MISLWNLKSPFQTGGGPARTKILWSGSSAKIFTYSTLFNPCGPNEIKIIALILRWENWDLEILVTCPRSRRQVAKQAFEPWSDSRFLFYYMLQGRIFWEICFPFFMIIEFGDGKKTNCSQILFRLELSVIRRWKFSWPVTKNPPPTLFCSLTSLKVERRERVWNKGAPCGPLMNVFVKGLSGKAAEIKSLLSQFLGSLTDIQKLTWFGWKHKKGEQRCWLALFLGKSDAHVTTHLILN